MRLLEKIKRIRIKDLYSGFIFLVAIPNAIILRKKRNNIWLICERENEARDNGYWLFKYIRENYPNEDVVYAIKKNAKDYNKVKKLGKIIEHGSFKHWVYYLAARKNISSQKGGGTPNAAICYLLEVYGILKNVRVYLKHGIIKDNMEWMHYKNTKFRLLICGARREYEYVKQVYGYPFENIAYLGLARFDNLHNFKIKKEQILIMPSWRSWLKEIDNDKFLKSEYYKMWMKVLSDTEINEILAKFDKKIIFYLHPNFQRYSNLLDFDKKNVVIATDMEYDIQDLLKESSLLITDYSSIFMDFAYMRKPMIFYHFDEKKYRKEQYQQGYFDYKRDGFGPVYNNFNEFKYNFIKIIENNFFQEKVYLKRERNFFDLYDNKNCERIYKAIKKI